MATAPIKRKRRSAVDTGLVYGTSSAVLLEADGVLELVEKALLNVLRLAANAAQLLQRLPLLFGQVGGNHDPHVDELVASAAGSHVRNAAAIDPEGLPVRGPGRNLDLLRPVDRWDLDRVAQRCLRHAQRQLVDHVGTLALQYRVRLGLEDDVQVGRGTAARGNFTL